VLYPSQAICDTVINCGMEHGAAESYHKLAEVLALETGSPGGPVTAGIDFLPFASRIGASREGIITD
jgi:hypothetical protein